jgi:predicted dehydrogenase
MQNRRYNKNIRAYRDLIASGAVGKLGYLGADFFIGARFGGFRAAMDNPLVLDMAIHTFDQARFISGADPVSVYCHEWNPPGSWYDGNANAAAIYEMSDGQVFCYRGSWCAEGANTSWECEWRAQGEKGTAVWDGSSEVYAEVVDAAKPKDFIGPFERVEARWNWTGRDGHAGCIDYMFAALESGKPAMTDCRDNIQSMRMVFGAIESAKTGRKIYMDEL